METEKLYQKSVSYLKRLGEDIKDRSVGSAVNRRWSGRWFTGIAFNYENRNTFGDIAFETVKDSVYLCALPSPQYPV